MNTDLQFPPGELEALVRQIASADSPVGIDAKKTHAIIIHLLLDIRARLESLEAQTD